MAADEALATSILRSGRVVAIVDGCEWDVVEAKDDPATLWFRLRKRGDDNQNDRRFIVLGSVSAEELQHVRRAKKLWAKPWDMNFALYSVQAKDVLSKKTGRVVVKLDKEVCENSSNP
jgi:hypothetical protein